MASFQKTDPFARLAAASSGINASRSSCAQGPSVTTRSQTPLDTLTQVVKKEVTTFLGLDWTMFPHWTNRDANPLAFWKAHDRSGGFPHLADLARRILSIPFGTPQVERLASVAGQVMNEDRPMLDPDKVNQLVFLVSALQFATKNPTDSSLPTEDDWKSLKMKQIIATGAGTETSPSAWNVDGQSVYGLFHLIYQVVLQLFLHQ